MTEQTTNKQAVESDVFFKGQVRLLCPDDDTVLEGGWCSQCGLMFKEDPPYDMLPFRMVETRYGSTYEWVTSGDTLYCEVGDCEYEATEVVDNNPELAMCNQCHEGFELGWRIGRGRLAKDIVRMLEDIDNYGHGIECNCATLPGKPDCEGTCTRANIDAFKEYMAKEIRTASY